MVTKRATKIRNASDERHGREVPMRAEPPYVAEVESCASPARMALPLCCPVDDTTYTSQLARMSSLYLLSGRQRGGR